MELAVQGKGIPIGRTGMNGALFLHVQVRYPPVFSKMELPPQVSDMSRIQ